LTAHLHEHTLHFDLPPDFARGRVDTLDIETRLHTDPFAPEVIAAIRTLVTETLSPAEAEMVVDVIAHVRAAEEALGHDKINFGLIHADLHRFNLLFARDTVRPIDFDDCGFGPRLYDMAVTLDNVPHNATYPALRAGLLAGYRRIRPLSAEHEGYIDTFIALRHLQDGFWPLRARRAYRPGADWLAEARTVLAPLPAFLANNGQFPIGP
jgi:Ser/Thr protein kinase RdoA (MazF antagonist)